MTLHEKAQTSLKGEVLTTKLLKKENSLGESVWHLAALYGSIKDIPQHLFTEEAVNYIDGTGNTAWATAAECGTLGNIPEMFPKILKQVNKNTLQGVFHLAARAGTLNKINPDFMTTEALSKPDYKGNTVWHLAAQRDGLGYIPKNLFTEEVLALKNLEGQSVLISAARHYCLNHIPPHVFTDKTINQIDSTGNTIFHLSAGNNTLEFIPDCLLTKNVMNSKNYQGDSVFSIIANSIHRNILQKLPVSLIDKDLLNMKTEEGRSLFNIYDTTYIEEVLQLQLSDKLQGFINSNPSLAKDIEFHDPRLIPFDVKDNSVCFQFEGVEEQVFLNKDGVFLNNENYNSLNEAVLFIQQTYPHIEQSLLLPNSTSFDVQAFTL